jgi:hypothetical protein
MDDEKEYYDDVIVHDCQRWDRIEAEGSDVSLCITFVYRVFESHRPLGMKALTLYESTAIYSFLITGIFLNTLVMYVAFTCVDFSVKANQVGG